MKTAQVSVTCPQVVRAGRCPALRTGFCGRARADSVGPWLSCCSRASRWPTTRGRRPGTSGCSARGPASCRTSPRRCGSSPSTGGSTWGGLPGPGRQRDRLRRGPGRLL